MDAVFKPLAMRAFGQWGKVEIGSDSHFFAARARTHAYAQRLPPLLASSTQWKVLRKGLKGLGGWKRNGACARAQHGESS